MGGLQGSVELGNCLGPLGPGAGRLKGQRRGWGGQDRRAKNEKIPPGTLPRTMLPATALEK